MSQEIKDRELLKRFWQSMDQQKKDNYNRKARERMQNLHAKQNFVHLPKKPKLKRNCSERSEQKRKHTEKMTEKEKEEAEIKGIINRMHKLNHDDVQKVLNTITPTKREKLHITSPKTRKYAETCKNLATEMKRKVTSLRSNDKQTREQRTALCTFLAKRKNQPNNTWSLLALLGEDE